MHNFKSLHYGYIHGTHLLESVTGALKNRDASAGNSFEYDLTGNMIKDKSRNGILIYGEDSRMVAHTFDGIMDTMRVLHDFDGNRVGSITQNGAVYFARWYVEIGGKRRAEIDWKSGGYTNVVTMLQGAGGTVGRRHNGSLREWFVKDWRGSVVRTVTDDGLGGYALDYSPYGEQKKLKVDANLSKLGMEWTGKEFDERTGLYYFGARWWDPELGIWIGADPARQFDNPFAFGGDPVNGVDRDGRWFGWDDAVAAGVGFVAGYTIHGATTGNWGLSAIKSGLKGAAVSWLTYNTGGFVTNAAIGAAGTAGVYDGGAAIVGGAIGGAIGGAVGASTGYAWDHTIGGEKGGSIDGFFDAFGDGLGKGAMAGALTSGLFYSMSEGVVNKTAQTVENFGYDHGLYNEAEIYDWYSGLPQRAVNYFANRVNDYRMHFIFREPPPIETPSARGMSFQGSLRSPSPQIFARAFFDPDNEFDITSMHATLDHEFAHEIYNQSWIEGYRLYVDENPMAMQFIRGNRNISLTSYVEYMNYSSHTYGYDYSQSAVQSLERMAKGYHDIFTSTYGGW